jgi:hypothetical protein
VPEFTVEKKDIIDVRRISDREYEVDYQWSGPIDPAGWDWDRINVSWRLRCDDSSGSHDRTLTQSQVLCVDGAWLWIAWGSEPDACMVVDCVPDSLQESDSGKSPVLPRGVLQTGLHALEASDGTIHLSLTSMANQPATHSWIASGGHLESTSDRAVWSPPADPGVHTVQVTTTAGKALSVNVYRYTRKP